MELDELPGEGQPETCAFRFPLRGAHLPELFEHGLLIRRRDADARIGDRHLRHLAVQPAADVDPAAFGRELQGVGEKVQEDLLHLPLVPAD